MEGVIYWTGLSGELRVQVGKRRWCEGDGRWYLRELRVKGVAFTLVGVGLRGVDGCVCVVA